ncbi:MAG: amidase domain-containing protein [Longibaculum sp.]
MKKILLALLSISLCLFSQIGTLYATGFCPYYPQISSEIDLISGPKIVLNGEVNDTYWVFQDTDDAFVKIRSLESVLINELKVEYNLPDFTWKTWHNYQDSLETFYDSGEISHENYLESKLRIFLEVCDNVERNNKIVELYNSNNFEEEEMAILLPYFSPYYEEYSEKISTNINPRASLNVSNMISYAEQWNYYYNPAFKKQSADCTNYVSQIARAGNAKESSGSADSISSWWWKGYDSYSVSWVRADYFVKHFGVAYSYKDFDLFTQKAYKGCFIAYDSEMDGKWNHCAFVTDVGTRGTYGDQVYRDLKIAQHTTNYNAWVSSSTNNWEKNPGIKAVIKAPIAK